MLSPLASITDRVCDTTDPTLEPPVNDLLNARFPRICHARETLARATHSPPLPELAHKAPGHEQAWGD